MDPVLEAELRFRAESDEPLEHLAQARTLGPATLGPVETAEETDAYLDTADRRLAASRWACRQRTRAGRTIVSLKGPPQHAPGDQLHRRPELEGPASETIDHRTWPASPARDQLMAMVGDAGLEVVVTLEQRRTERVVMVAGRPAGLLSLDRVRIRHEGADRGLIRIVELELRNEGGPGRDPAPLGVALAAVPGLQPDPQSKYERALALIEAAGR